MTKKSEIKYMWYAYYRYGRQNYMGMWCSNFRSKGCYFNDQANAMSWVLKGYKAVQAKGMVMDSSDVKLVKMRKTYLAVALIHNPNYSEPLKIGEYSSVDEKKTLATYEKYKLFWGQRSYRTAPDPWGETYPITIELRTGWQESK